MLTSYLKSALRHFRRRAGLASLNIAGLAIGLAASLMIALYVQDELRYDAFHDRGERIYRVLREFDLPDLRAAIPQTPNALAPALAGAAGVERAVRVYSSSPVVAYGGREFVETRFIAADDGFFAMFSFPVVRGAADLRRPDALVISQSMAAKYFAGEEPIGKVLRVRDRDIEVTGVFADVPRSSHLAFDFVTAYPIERQLGWGINDDRTYLLLAPGASSDAVTRQVARIVGANVTNPSGFIPHLQPLRDIHFGRGVSVDIAATGNMLYVYLFGTLAVFIVVLGCINFMNLATARSAERAREVGLRKAIGARRAQVAAQFLVEAVLSCSLALLIALAVCALLMPWFNTLTDKSMSAATLLRAPQVLVLLTLPLVVGLAAGSYPALLLSRFQPTVVLKSARSRGGETLRKVLVTFQFAVSIVLIAGTGIVIQQFRYMESAGLGFDPSGVLLVRQANYLAERVDTFADAVAALPGVQAAAPGYSMPGTFFMNSMWAPAEPNAAAHNLDYSFVGADYVDTLRMQLVAGRSLSRAMADEVSVLLNEAAARDFGWSPQEAIGKRITPAGGDAEATVVGVVEDFHYRSLHREIYPLALFSAEAGPAPRYVAVRAPPDGLAETLAAIETAWKGFSDLPFEYSFLADDLAAQYRAEQRLSSIVGAFAALAIVVACLGLFGLAAFAADRRAKEFGVRKVLGASTLGLAALLSQEFLRLIVVGFLLAAPVAYLAARSWLDAFAYRIEPGMSSIFGAGFLALAVAMATVGYQALRAARARPVVVLKSE